MNQEILKKRFKDFALRIMKLVRALPKTIEGKAVGNQIFRSGTSSAANYRAACRARSKKDFIAKLGIVEEELDEISTFNIEARYENIKSDFYRKANKAFSAKWVLICKKYYKKFEVEVESE